MLCNAKLECKLVSFVNLNKLVAMVCSTYVAKIQNTSKNYIKILHTPFFCPFLLSKLNYFSHCTLSLVSSLAILCLDGGNLMAFLKCIFGELLQYFILTSLCNMIFFQTTFTFTSFRLLKHL